jgi:hypothetical protein
MRLPSSGAPQPTWTGMATFPASVGGREVISFAVGNNGYIAIPCSIWDPCSAQGGQFWAYYPQGNRWIQLQDHPSLAFESPSFVIGGNAYVISGTEVWQYTPTLDRWTRKGDIPGTDKRGAFSFSVNGVGYIGGGYYNKCALWQYNLGNDRWTPKNNIPVLEYGLNDPLACSIQGIAFTNGTTAYVTGTNSYFWAYSPSTDTWATKAYVNAVYGQAFSIGTNGYVFNTFGALYKYDAAGDQWIAAGSAYSGTTMCYPAGFAIGSSLYVGVGGLFAGNTCNLNVVNQWWRFGQ